MQRMLALVVAFLGLTSAALAEPVESFESFIKNFEATAVAAGVTHETYAKAMYGLTPDANVPELVAAQPEFTTPLWEYIDKRVTQWRIDKGKEASVLCSVENFRSGAMAALEGVEQGDGAFLLRAEFGIAGDGGVAEGIDFEVTEVVAGEVSDGVS